MFLEDGCRLPAETCPSPFPFNFMELSAVKTLMTETSVCRDTKFGEGTFMLKRRVYHQPSSQWLSAAFDSLALGAVLKYRFKETLLSSIISYNF